MKIGNTTQQPNPKPQNVTGATQIAFKATSQDISIRVGQSTNLAQNEIMAFQTLQGEKMDKEAFDLLLNARTDYYYAFLTKKKQEKLAEDK
jgi:hypothetical protein